MAHRCDRQRVIDDFPDIHEPDPTSPEPPASDRAFEPAAEPAGSGSSAPEQPPAAPRARRGYLIAFGVVVVAWGAGLLGAWMGVKLADDDRAPARTASTLGLVKVEPRDAPLPTLDVFAVASMISPSIVNISALTSDGELVGSSTGSGVIITADGEIVTNAHVVADAVTVSVRVAGETEPRGATVVATDESRDLALLRIDGDGLAPATFAAAGDVRIGDDVVAVGYALDLDGDPSVTVGIVSAVDRTSTDELSALKGLIQTDAPISSGNSGGPLVNALGEVVGLVTFVALGNDDITANSLGFAISNAELLPGIERLRAAANGNVAPAGFLGVSLSERIDGGSGALVIEVVDGSPADQAGVEVGDAIVGVDGVTITGPAGLMATIRDAGPGDEVQLDIRRGGRERSLTATLAERPAE